MGERLCLRCDWTGDVEGNACPRCGVPLYRMSRPDLVEARKVPAPAQPRTVHAPSSARASRDSWSFQPAHQAARGRWKVIALAVSAATIGITFVSLSRAPLTPPAEREQTEPEPAAQGPGSIQGSPTPAIIPAPEPVRCGDERAPKLESPPATAVPASAADYRFQGSLGSSTGSAPDLVEIGRGASAYSDEGMIGRAVLSITGGRGLALAPTSRVIDDAAYSIELLFRLDRVDGYRKIVDFMDGSVDSGLYVLDGCLNFFPRPPIRTLGIEVDAYTHVVLTRDPSARVVAYVDGIRQFAFVDREGLAEIDGARTLRFLADDSTTGIEFSGGAVSRIRLYDRPLTAEEVAALACAELRVPLATTPCRDADG